MPTYEYVCTSCGHRLEKVQSFSDPALTSCPVCGGELRKVYGNVGIVLKGSGFYKTDSRTSGANGASKKEKEKESTSSGDSGAKESAPPKDASPSTSSSSGSNSSGSSSSEKAATTSTS